MSDQVEIDSEVLLSSDNFNIQVNAENKLIKRGTTISKLLSDMDINGRFLVVVNDEVIPMSARANTQLNVNDKIDIMSPISGG
ncbi:sulfur carrier protein ThiS [Pseudomonadota bacterium]|nr:sulfur carrier protein ThiS [Pseudomonadota bacterium]